MRLRYRPSPLFFFIARIGLKMPLMKLLSWSSNVTCVKVKELLKEQEEKKEEGDGDVGGAEPVRPIDR